MYKKLILCGRLQKYRAEGIDDDDSMYSVILLAS